MKTAAYQEAIIQNALAISGPRKLRNQVFTGGASIRMPMAKRKRSRRLGKLYYTTIYGTGKRK